MSRSKLPFVDPDFATCRDLGHAWPRAYDWSIIDRAIHRTLQCAACGTERMDVVSLATGEIVDYRYHYVDGYLVEVGPNGARTTRAEFRKAAMEHLIAESKGAQPLRRRSKARRSGRSKKTGRVVA